MCSQPYQVLCSVNLTHIGKFWCYGKVKRTQIYTSQIINVNIFCFLNETSGYVRVKRQTL